MRSPDVKESLNSKTSSATTPGAGDQIIIEKYYLGYNAGLIHLSTQCVCHNVSPCTAYNA